MKIKGFYVKAEDENGNEYLTPISMQEVKKIISKLETFLLPKTA